MSISSDTPNSTSPRWRFIDACEPGAFDACEIRGLDENENENEEGLRVGGFSAFQGSMALAVLTHNIPTPAAHLIEHCALSKEVKEGLAGHRSFALLTLLGGDELPAIERILYMYKAATALCLQGGIGVGNLHTGRVLPGLLLSDLFGKSHPEAEGTGTVWDAMREGELIEMFAHFGMVELLGRRFLATCGFGYCGLPDLVWEYTNRKDAEVVTNMFRNCYSYMVQRGPVIKAGHTVGYDENVAFRFSAPPEGLELPYPSLGALVMRKERAG